MTANDGLDSRPSAEVPDQIHPVADDIAQWIASARGGCRESLGQLAEHCRQYLLLVADQELVGALRGKVGASDVVQETMLTAHKVFAHFDGETELQLRLWLRQILLHKLAHAGRYYGQVAKRDAHREQRLDTDDGESNWLGLVDQAQAPRTLAIANEQAETIERAILQLPPHKQHVVRLRCFEQLSFVQIGELLNTSPDAARKLWCRAIEALGQGWAAHDESH